MKRLLVTGSRTWSDAVRLEDYLSSVTDDSTDWMLVSGACPSGADAMAEGWAARRFIQVERHPANWDAYGHAAGLRRNVEMVSAGADMCVAFLDVCRSEDCERDDVHASHGALHCMGRAKAAGIPTVVVADSALLPSEAPVVERENVIVMPRGRVQRG